MTVQRPRQIFRRTRSRLTIVYAGLWSIVVLAAAIVFWNAFDRFELYSIDQSLVAQARTVAATVRRSATLQTGLGSLPAETAQGIHVDAVLFDPEGRLLQTSGPTPSPNKVRSVIATATNSGQPVYLTASIGGLSRRVLAEQVDAGHPETGILVVTRSTIELDQTLFLVGVLLAISAVILVGVGSSLGYWLAGRALAPVRRITATARDLSEHDLHRRVDLDLADDELGDLADTLNSLLARLETAFDLQRQFTSDAAHEFRVPLALMRTDIEVTLRRSREPRHYQRTLTGLLAEVERLSRMTEQLLLLARADAGMLGLDYQPVDLVDLVVETVHLWQPLTDQRRLTVRTNLPRIGTCGGDELLLRRVLDNLLDNSVRYAPAGSEIQIALLRRNGVWRLTVEDQGPGVDPALRESIFTRFMKADPARELNSGGAGLGLALCSAIVALHRGSIAVDPSRSPGARFIVTLPAT
jgi:heavy metal sensor kinase